jgi:hypothetical protein
VFVEIGPGARASRARLPGMYAGLSADSSVSKLRKRLEGWASSGSPGTPSGGDPGMPLQGQRSPLCGCRLSSLGLQREALITLTK